MTFDKPCSVHFADFVGRTLHLMTFEYEHFQPTKYSICVQQHNIELSNYQI